MIAELLPEGVAGREVYGDPPDAWLYPEEEAVLARAVDKRRREFAGARWCARAALADLGVAPAPILPGGRGAPRWPAGVVGSMTHCAGYRAAAVAGADRLLSVGIDAEPDEPLPDGVLESVSLPEERAWARPGGPVSWDRLLFSAKESVYKAWFPLTRAWLGFEDAHVEVDPRAGTFTARLLVDPPIVDGRPLKGFTGRWAAGNGLVVTAIAVPRGGGGPA